MGELSACGEWNSGVLRNGSGMVPYKICEKEVFRITPLQCPRKAILFKSPGPNMAHPLLGSRDLGIGLLDAFAKRW